MKMTGNTILITGGGSGIGLALAEEFRKRDNQVLIAGRSASKLADVASRGFKTLTVDMTDRESIRTMAKSAVREFSSLNVVIHNAGIMKTEDLLHPKDSTNIIRDTVATNLLGPLYLTEDLMPHLLQKTSATIMTVTSGLAYVPLNLNPTYCATKAAIHSYTQSLRYQLKDTAVEVLELAPPYVQTTLTGAHQATDPHAMPLAEYIAEVMQILSSQPQPKEILVKRVHPLRFATDGGSEKYDAFYKQFNDAMVIARKR